jgi:hypothetical protein
MNRFDIRNANITREFLWFLFGSIAVMLVLFYITSIGRDPSEKREAARDGIIGLLKIYQKQRDMIAVGYVAYVVLLSKAFVFNLVFPSASFLFQLNWFAAWLSFPLIYLTFRLQGAKHISESAKLVTGCDYDVSELIYKLEGEIRQSKAILQSHQFLGYDYFPSAILIPCDFYSMIIKPCIIVPTANIKSFSYHPRRYGRMGAGKFEYVVKLHDEFKKELHRVKCYKQIEAESLMSELRNHLGIPNLFQ